MNVLSNFKVNMEGSDRKEQIYIVITALLAFKSSKDRLNLLELSLQAPTSTQMEEVLGLDIRNMENR